MNNQISLKSRRLTSLDALRGLDLFCIVGMEAVAHALHNAIDEPWANRAFWFFDHVEWRGFSTWDLIMPLFLFMAGVSIPFALGKYRSGQIYKSRVYRKILKRFVLLWVFGMVCQGNLLGLDPDRIYLYSNTLQSIAIGYLASALLFLNTRWKAQAIVYAILVALFWAIMKWCGIDGYGFGNYTPEANLAEWVDMTVLGRFRDTAYVVGGVVVKSPGYTYTWVLSSLTFIATVLSGTLAGHLLRYEGMKPVRKAVVLMSAGIILVAFGWLWDAAGTPVIKRIWSSSMVLVSSGYSFMLMSAFYYWIDCRGHNRHLMFLKVYGMNSIAAYMLATCISFTSVSESLLYGFQHLCGSWYHVIIATANAAMIFGILYLLYRNKIFLKV